MPLLAAFHLLYPALAWIAAVLLAVIAARFRAAAKGGGWIGGSCLIAAATLAAIAGGETGHAFLFIAGLVAAAWLAVEVYRPAGNPGLIGGPRLFALYGRFGLLAIALLLAARPAGEWTVVEQGRPLLVVLLDQSRSMSIVDPDAAASAASRADIAGAVLRRARLERLRTYYDLRIRAIGEEPRELRNFDLSPSDPVTSLESSLRAAARIRADLGQAARYVLIVSDGAENVADAQRVNRAAVELAEEKAGILAFGVGPARGGAVLAIDPLQVPARIGTRERLLVPVTLRSSGCRDTRLALAAAWDDAKSADTVVTPSADPAITSAELTLAPPGPGVHRLTITAALPPARGGGLVSRSALVEVRDERIRVLIVAEQFRSENAFISRALRSDPAFVVEQRILAPAGAALSTGQSLDDADSFDVILVGDLMRGEKPGDAYDRIARTVMEHGVGLCFAGGAATTAGAAATHSILLDILPTRANRAAAPPPATAQLIPTALGLEHPIFASSHDRATALAAWKALPAVAIEPLPAELKPLATVLATDERQAPLLVALDAGRGRIVQSALRETWPWALASDEGLELQRRFWRQIARWLANRRPQAWVLSDQPAYRLSAITSGREPVRIRAGVTGLEGAERLDDLLARLTVTPLGKAASSATSPATSPSAPLEQTVVPLTLRNGEWQAELPGTSAIRLGAGRYEINFTVAPRPSTSQPTTAAGLANAFTELQAASAFEIETLDRELEPPTQNLGLLRDVADATRSFGGRYASIDALPAAVDELLAHDPRERIETKVDYDVVRRQPWLLLAIVTAAVAAEWVIRRRNGLR